MRTCKYCGAELTNHKKNRSHICGRCYDKAPLLPMFVRARDKLRVKCGLPPLSSDENTCSIVD